MTAIFGGAFDPPHLGHVLCALFAKQVASIDRLLVLPSARHPYGKQMAPFAMRMDLCRAAFGDLAFVDVRDDEQDNESGRTWDLLKILQQRIPGQQWFLIGGTDTEHDLPQWYRGADLLERVTVIPVPRRGYDDEHPAALPAISSTRVREALAAGMCVDGLVPQSVAKLIAAADLYSRTQSGS